MKKTMIDGRSATVAYLNSKFEPVSQAEATLVKVIFDDGEIIFLTPAPKNA